MLRLEACANFILLSSANPIKSAEDSSETAGALMALIKKIDVDKYFAAKRNMRLGRIGLLSRPSPAAALPVEKVAKASRSTVNRARGTSLPSVPAIAIPIVASSGVKEDRTLPGRTRE